jgi:hypothetical protein
MRQRSLQEAFFKVAMLVIGGTPKPDMKKQP